MIDPLSRASNPLVSVHRWLWRTNRLALMRGLALAMVVPLAGVALLGLSGWFITAAGAAGLLGLGVSFDVFRPSAGVRFLALTRTAARYGERLLTHDATLRNLATLRVHLLRTMTGHGWPRSVRLRGSNLLNRITADVDTLDGLTLRLLIPIAAAVGTVLVVSIALALLTDARIALWSLLVFVTGTVVTLWWSASSTVKPARRATAAMQALRARSVDLLRARTELAMAGRLLLQCEHVMDAEQRAAIASRQIDAIERRATFALSLVTTLAAAIAFALGAILAQNDLVTPAQAALGFFAVLALAEAVRPLNQGLSEFGRMLDAARRIDATLQIETPSATQTAWPIARPHVHESVHVIAPPAMPPRPHRPRLDFHEITYRKPGAILPLLERCSLSVASGETVALSGPSGCGKSTVLLLASGLLNADSGSILIGNQTLPFDHEPTLRQWLSLLPQRSALFSGTVRDNLALARPTLSDGDAWRVLKAVALDQVMGNRQGLDTRLLESGSGLSGGERRRLALARVLLRDTPVLLLDEPTEGLDHDTATAVLAGIQAYRPDTTRLIAAHRTAELAWADRVISLDAL